MNRAVGLVEAEFTAAGKAEEFGHLQPWLAGGPTISQAVMAEQLGLSEGRTQSCNPSSAGSLP